MKTKVAVLVALSLVWGTSSWAENTWLDKVKAMKDKGISTATSTSLSDTKIGEGLKEALKVGIKNAIDKTGKTDGFLKNDAIKINVPDNLKLLDKGLRTLGMGNAVDEFVLSMNRSAEKAVPLATDTFMDSIFKMSIDDAQKILKGSDTAATEFFKQTTYAKLQEAFRPTIQKTMNEYGVTKKYNDLVGKYSTMPFAKKMPVFNPEDYVLNKGLDGLFLVLGQEEAKIRKDPAARVTNLLKQVFK